MILNGVVDVQEKYNFLFSVRYVLYDIQCAHTFTHALKLLNNTGQKNLFLS